MPPRWDTVSSSKGDRWGVGDGGCGVGTFGDAHSPSPIPYPLFATPQLRSWSSDLPPDLAARVRRRVNIDVRKPRAHEHL